MPLSKSLVAAAIVILTASPVVAQNAQSRALKARADRLTIELLADHGRYLAGGSNDRSPLAAALLSKATERETVLASLIADDPGAVLQLAVSETIRSAMPQSAQAHVESQVSVDGALEILAEDYATNARVRHYLRTADGSRLSLHFAGAQPDALTGDRVRVRGVRLGDALALQGGAVSLQNLGGGGSNTFGDQKTLVILVNFQDNAAQPYSVSEAYNVAFTTTSDYDREASSGQTWLSGDVAGWFTIPLSSSVCDPTAIAGYAQTAAGSAGVNVNNYSRYVYAFPTNACGWWGLGTVGGNPSQAWVNGSLQLKVLAHEMGHNFGLYHAHSLDCGAASIGSSCVSSDYGDTVDMMGLESPGHFTAFAKERLGWLNYGSSPPLTTVSSSGTYFIEGFATSGTRPKGLKVLKSISSTGQRTWYYLEFRLGSGFDSFLAGNSNISNGVLIHTGTEATPGSSYLLDMTPGTDSWYDPALTVGASFTDPDAGVTITVRSVDATGAYVDVQVGSVVCVHNTPVTTVSPSATVWTTAGSSLQFTVSVANQDGSGCPSSTFNLSDSSPPGWVTSLSTPAVTIAPGASASASMIVNVPATATGGSYSIMATGTSADAPGYTSSASVTCTVPSDLSVQVSTNTASYTRHQTVNVSAFVTTSGRGVSGVPVAFTVTRSDGTKVTGSGTTDANGRAAFSLKLKGKCPVGAWRVDSKATLGGTAASASATFTVH
jgi:hypothetical protein